MTDDGTFASAYDGPVCIEASDDNFQIGEEQMSAEQNEATVRTWVDEAWNKGNVDGQAHIFSSAYTWPELPPIFGAGSQALLNFVRAFRAAFPDLHFEIEDVVANDDKVVWRCVGTGTQRAEFMGIPATGKSIRVQAIIMSRFEDGLWAEDRVCWDQLGMLQQLGVIPASEAAVGWRPVGAQTRAGDSHESPA